VLFGAQQFRSQVHRRVVGNAGTSLYGRMDADELASPGYSVLSPAVRTRLSTLEKGQLMVRHPHFTQPIFVRFPRPAVMSGRAGMAAFPAARDEPLDQVIVRRLRRVDPKTSPGWVKQIVDLYDSDEVLTVCRAAELERPPDVRTFVEGRLRRVVATRAPVNTPVVVPIRKPPAGNPYGF